MVSLKQIFLYIGQMSFHIRLSLNFILFLYIRVIRLYIILLLFARFVYIYFVAKKYNFSFLFLKFISLIIRMAPIKL
jgi:hypothetical protein